MSRTVWCKWSRRNEESLQVCRAQRENFVQALKDRMSYNEILSLIDGGKVYGN